MGAARRTAPSSAKVATKCRDCTRQAWASLTRPPRGGATVDGARRTLPSAARPAPCASSAPALPPWQQTLARHACCRWPSPWTPQFDHQSLSRSAKRTRGQPWRIGAPRSDHGPVRVTVGVRGSTLRAADARASRAHRRTLDARRQAYRSCLAELSTALLDEAANVRERRRSRRAGSGSPAPGCPGATPSVPATRSDSGAFLGRAARGVAPHAIDFGTLVVIFQSPSSPCFASPLAPPAGLCPWPAPSSAPRPRPSVPLFSPCALTPLRRRCVWSCRHSGWTPLLRPNPKPRGSEG